MRIVSRRYFTNNKYIHVTIFVSHYPFIACIAFISFLGFDNPTIIPSNSQWIKCCVSDIFNASSFFKITDSTLISIFVCIFMEEFHDA